MSTSLPGLSTETALYEFTDVARDVVETNAILEYQKVDPCPKRVVCQD